MIAFEAEKKREVIGILMESDFYLELPLAERQELIAHVLTSCMD